MIKSEKIFIEQKNIALKALEDENCSLFLYFDQEKELDEFLRKLDEKFPEINLIKYDYSLNEFYICGVIDSYEPADVLITREKSLFLNEKQLIIYLPDLRDDGILATLDVILKQKMESLELFGGCRIIFVNTNAEKYVKFHSELSSN